MPFLIHKRQSTEAGVLHEQVRPLKFGEVAGPIARFVQTLKGDQAAAGWERDAAALAKIAGDSDAAGELTVLFDASSGKADEL